MMKQNGLLGLDYTASPVFSLDMFCLDDNGNAALFLPFPFGFFILCGVLKTQAKAKSGNISTVFNGLPFGQSSLTLFLMIGTSTFSGPATEVSRFWNPSRNFHKNFNSLIEAPLLTSK
ncbi:hypothetical protein CsSME_00051015 [Camellia sinensis var. sinensis]